MATTAITPTRMVLNQLKGRLKDLEAAEFSGTSQNSALMFRAPIRQKTKSSGVAFGNAMHSVMQHLNFKCCRSITDIHNDIERMVLAKLITREQADMVAIDKIYRFFQSDLGKRFAFGNEVLREFKFSILEDASEYYNGAAGDSILLQGVIDCALIEEEGIIILDFKTDWITDTNRQEKVALYRDQIVTYAKALSRIYEKPVAGAYLYFFSSEEFVAIK